MHTETIAILTRRFGQEKIRQKPGRGNYLYIAGEDIIERLNEAFCGNYSIRVKDEKTIGDKWIVVRAELEAVDPRDNSRVIREGYGSSDIKTYTSGSNQGQPLDPGNDYKSALTDAIKKIAYGMGVGLEDLRGAIEQSRSPQTGTYGSDQASTTVPNVTPKNQGTLVPPIPLPPRQSKQTVISQKDIDDVVRKNIEGIIKDGTIAPSTSNQIPLPAPRPSIDNTTHNAPFPFVPKPISTGQPEVRPITNPFLPPLNNTNQNNTLVSDKISRAQLDALNRMSQVKGTPQQELIRQAFEKAGLNTAVPNSFDKLSYKESIAVIRYANILPDR